MFWLSMPGSERPECARIRYELLPEEPTPQQEAAVKCGVDWSCQWVFLGKSSGVQISGGLPDKLGSHDSRGPIGGVGTRKSREVMVLRMWREPPYLQKVHSYICSVSLILSSAVPRYFRYGPRRTWPRPWHHIPAVTATGAIATSTKSKSPKR